jgi:hypothetical protein
MTTKMNKLKWLLSLVLIFGGFAVYEFFEVLAHEFADKKSIAGYLKLLPSLVYFRL